MNILIVDDQKMIADNLKSGVNWNGLGVDQVYAAYGAMEAKLLLINFQIDILITDIEMPGEDGLELFQWAREKFPDIECIFLTSHADFEYAKKAVQLGGFDYILQPARYSDVEKAVLRASEKVQEHLRQKNIEESRKLVLRQKDLLLNGMLQKLTENHMEEAGMIWRHLRELFQLEYEDMNCFPALIRIGKWKEWPHTSKGDLLQFAVQNIFQELLDSFGGNLCISGERERGYMVLAVGDREKLTEENWKEIIGNFYEFMTARMESEVTVYPGRALGRDSLQMLKTELVDRYNNITRQESRIVWEVMEEASDAGEYDEALRVQKAVKYIRDNLNRNISRADIASIVFLNEDYFSRLFKQETGYTYKEFALMEKMNLAKKLLANTGFSISIIASKVGYDNFSHFSKMFKKTEGVTPQEYRKEYQNKKSQQ